MKIKIKMLDRQLRVPGMFFRIFLRFPGEAAFRRFRRLSRCFRGRRIRGLDCREVWIPRTRGGSSLRACVYRKPGAPAGVPGLLWMHGGGYALGVPEASAGHIRRFVMEGGCAVVAPDYRLSPEAPYPAALEDCHDALAWMKGHAAELGIRDDRLMAGGDSAGGGLAAALCLYERDAGGVRIACQIPLYPMLDDRMDSVSSRDNNAPVWDSVANRAAWDLYLGGLTGDAVLPYAAPARAADYSGLPPAITFVGSLEPFLDEVIQYVKNLRDAGVPVDFEVFEGCYHAFDSLNPRAAVSRRAAAFLMDSFRSAAARYSAPQEPQA